MTAQPPSGHFKTRRTHRTPVSGTSALRHQFYTVKVRIRDVSTEGFMAECHEPIRIGSYVSLDVPGIGVVNAQVRWQLGVKMGGQFVDPISLARCEWTATPVAPSEAA
ncbi:MAG: PilZ domain-containing protein [Alphaproteobacteria bacterium]|nr:PilZ domain-containing protein [Alphaproteobacteria bacterium]